jgi:hypothetical protein
MSNMPSLAVQAATDVRLRDHLGDLVGLGPKGLDKLESNYPYTKLRGGELTMDATVRKRADDSIALEPPVRKHISNQYVDRFLEDCITVLDIDDDRAGYFYPEFNLRARVHGTACGLGSVKPAKQYPHPFLDAMADLRGYGIVTNIGQSGCSSCAGPGIERLIDDLEEHDSDVLGYAGFSAQQNPDSLSTSYWTFDEVGVTTEELGYLILSTLDKHDVPAAWDGDTSVAIEAYPDKRTRY